MNKKGFAATGILYTILVLFILLIFSLLTMLYSRNSILSKIRNEIKGNIYQEVVLNVNGTKLINPVSSQVQFDITGQDVSDVTNIVCNKGVDVNISGNTVTLDKVLGGTECTMNSSLATTISGLGKAGNYITMLSDEIIPTTMYIKSGYSVVLELNGKTIKTETYGSTSTTYTKEEGVFIISGGNLVINDSIGTGQMLCSPMMRTLYAASGANLVINGGSYEGRQVIGLNEGRVEINNGNFVSNIYSTITNYQNGEIVINGGTFSIGEDVEATESTYVVYNYSTGTVDINGGNFVGNINSSVVNYSTGVVNINGGTFEGSATNTVVNTGEGVINITGGTIKSVASSVINSGTGEINVNQKDSPIYISTTSTSWNPSLYNSSTGSINVMVSDATNTCTSDSTKTTSGLCVYQVSGGAAVQNNGGVTNITGGTYIGASQGINNGSNGGTINVKNATVRSSESTLYNNGTGTINVCNSTVTTSNSDKGYDIFANKTGLINYSSNVIFTNGTNTPIIGGTTSSIIKTDDTCS